MKRKILVAMLVAAIACVGFAQATKLNLSGTWERVALGGYGNPGTETMTFFIMSRTFTCCTELKMVLESGR